AHVIQLGRALVQRGVAVAAICDPRPELRALRESLAEAGVHVHSSAAGTGTGLLGPIRRLWELTRILRQYPRCVVHLHYGGFGGGELIHVAALLARVGGIVRTEHVPPVPPFTWRKRLLVRVRDGLLARIVCVAQSNRREHIERLGRDPNKLVVVHNGIDLAALADEQINDAVKAELGVPCGAPLIGTVSRLGEARKGIDYFLEMVASVLQALPDARFVTVGDGSLRPRLEQQAVELGVSGAVKFLGARPDVPRLLCAMDVFVMPSLYEAGPYTVLEALAMRRPVVSTPVGLVPE